MFGVTVLIYFVLLVAISIGVVLRPIGASRRWRPAKLRVRLLVGFALFLIVLPVITPALPDAPLAWLFPGIARAETVASPEYVNPTVLPNGQVGMIFRNDAGGGVVETRFKRYFVEWGMDPSQQLSTAAPAYPQLAAFQGKTIAAYVDSRSGSPTQGQLLARVSTDNGASWAAEYSLFGTETFDGGNSAPLLVASRDGTKLYLFNCCVSSLPQYRYTTDPALVTWTSPVPAGDASMRVVSGNNCGLAAAECYRAHTFEFTETATAGNWVYIAKSDSGYGQSGRGTQVGTLGGSWSAQVDHGGSGGLSGGGESRATAFLDRAGNVIYVRGGERGDYLYYKKSTDGGFTWSGTTTAYTNPLDIYTVGSPVGLFVPKYTRGEYVWYAGWGGIGNGNDQNAMRVIPLWTGSNPYVDTGTVRLFGSLGGDYDFGSAYPYTFGWQAMPTSIGAFKTSDQDLGIAGANLNFDFSRYYGSADVDTGPLGPAWTHSFNWSLLDNTTLVQIRRGDGRRDAFSQNQDGTYAPPPNVYDVLTKNGDSTFTLTLKNQTQYEFSTAGKLTRIHEPAGNQLLLNYTNGRMNSVTDATGRTVTFGYTSGTNAARAKTYTESAAPWVDYPDSGGTELTDGTVGNSTNYADPTWQAHRFQTTVDFTVDLGSTQSVALTRMWFYEDGNYGIVKPTTVEIQTSTDNIGYTSRGSTADTSAVNDAGRNWRYDLSITPVNARYVRFHVTPNGQWLFSSELEVYLTGLTPAVAQAGNNVGATRTYSKSVAADASYPDTGGTELTDNNLGNPLSFGDASWQGHSNLGSTPLDVTVDLGTAQRVGVVRSFHYQDSGNGIFRPGQIEMFTSTDNTQYTSRGITNADSAINDTGNRWRYEFDLAGVSARWVRFRITSGGTWLFSSETQVFAEGAGPITLPLSYGDRLTSVADPIGRKVTYGYDQNGRLTRVVDKVGNAAGQDPTLHTWHYVYDLQSQHITAVIDPDSRTRITNTYNGEGRLATQKDGAGNLSIFGYGDHQTTITDARGHMSTQAFDSRWRVSSQTDVVGSNTYALQSFYEDAGSNLTATVDRNGNRTDFTYDSRGNLLTRTDPQVPPAPRYLTQYQYDLRNNVTQVTDARNFVTTHTFDPITNVRLSTTQQITTGPATYAVTKWQYGDPANPGLPTRIITPRGNTLPTPDNTYSQTLSYDSQANLIQRLDADGNKTTFGYDGVGRQTTMVDADGYAPGGNPADHTWTTVYDQNDRVTQMIDPLTHATITAFDAAGNTLSVTDRNGNVTTFAYDGAGRMATVQQKPDPVGQPSLVYTTAVVRDPDGNASQVTQGNNVVTNYGYDALNRLTSAITHPTGVLNLTTSYVLDGNGNVTSRTAGDTTVTSYQYDALNRLNQISASGLSTITYGYDELSRRTSMGDATGSSTYSYDGLGRLTQTIQPNGTLGYGYDLDSNPTTLTYPTVGAVTDVSSPAGRLSTVTDWSSRISTYTYFASGRVHTVAVPGGMTTTYLYDNAQRLSSLVNSTPAGTITSDIYTLDNEGNRTGIDEVLPDGTFPSVKVNTDAGTVVQDHPAIAIGADGASYLVWDDARLGNADIYFSRRNPTTGAWSTPNDKVNNDAGTRVQVNPAISTDSSSNAYAVWEDSRDGANNKIDTNIYSSKRPTGGSWLANTKVNDDTSQNPVQRNPRIAGTAAGMETAVWVDLRANQNNIYSSQLTVAGGTTWGGNKKVTDNTSVAKDFPDVAVDSANTAYAVWQDSRNGNADTFFSSLTNGGSAWAANEKISDDPGTTAQTKARIGVDSAGNLIAAWVDARTTPSQIRARRRPSGSTWTAAPASVVVSPSPANAQSLALSVRPDGFAWAVWGDTRGTSQDIWGSRYDPNLNAWSTPLRLDDDPGTTAAQLNPTVAFGPAETALSWRDNRLNANGDTQARRILFVKGMTDHIALAYDGLNRLKSVSGPASESFTFDGASNVTSRTGPSQTETYDTANRLISNGSQSFTWSNADRLTNRGADTFGYDALDRLTSSTVGGIARTYAYNGDGLLQTRTQGAATTFLWDPSSSPTRELKQGSDNIVYGLSPLYVVKADGTTSTFARDGSKNVRAEVTSTGAVTAAFRYRAYGEIAQSSSGGSPTYLGLASQLIDPSGLYFMRARWYDPAQGRFLSRDASKGTASAPASLNAYGYASGDPIGLADPSGMCPIAVAVFAPAAFAALTPELVIMATIVTGVAVAGLKWVLSAPPPQRSVANLSTNTTANPSPEKRPPESGTDPEYIYRGVGKNHEGYDDALNGVAKPRGGTATMEQHTQGETRSPYTSWTSDISVAQRFAGPDGVVLRVDARSVNIAGWSDEFDESEALVEGVVRGADVLMP